MEWSSTTGTGFWDGELGDETEMDGPIMILVLLLLSLVSCEGHD